MDAAPHEESLAELQDSRTAFARLPVRAKAELLGRLRRRIGRVAERWVGDAAHHKGIDPGSPLVGEEWTSGPYALASGMRALETTLLRIAAGDDILDGLPVSTRPDGRVVVRAFPADLQDRVFLSGHRADVWMQPGVTEEGLGDTMAVFYRDPAPQGAVCLVLGAGNLTSIAPLDALYRMFVHGDVVIAKLNPMNDYVGEHLEDVFAPAIDAGWIRFVYGGGDIGTALAHHPAVDRIHLTGGAATHDALVFGPGPEGMARRAADRPLLEKPLTSELGGVSPTIVVPGDWSAADFRHQAAHVVTQKLHNAGHNCVASQVLVLADAWPGSDRLLEEIRSVVERLPMRDPYYPGTARRIADLAGHDPAQALPQLLMVDAESDAGAPSTTNEAFGPLLAVTRLAASSPPDFLATAVAFANERLPGTLSANILIDPPTARAHAATLDRAITELRYGTIAVNTWTGVGFGLPRVPWGGFPGATRQEIESGVGVVHNALMFGRSERTVIRGPFAPFPRSLRWGESHVEPTPPTFVTNGNAAVVGERLTRQAISGSWRHVPGIVTAAMRG